MNRPWLYDGDTTLTRGHGVSAGVLGGSCALSSVHGQPVLPGGGGGSWSSVGEAKSVAHGHRLGRPSLNELAVPIEVGVCLAGQVELAGSDFRGRVADAVAQVGV